jgi:Lamin Tail Domain
MMSLPLCGPSARRVAASAIFTLAVIAGCAANSGDNTAATVPTDEDGGSGYKNEAGSWLGLEDGAPPADPNEEPPAQHGRDAGPLPDAGPPIKPVPGEISISEIMYNPSGPEPDQEWFELYNSAAGPRLLDGLILEDGPKHTHIIAGLKMAPKSFVVLARNKSAAVAAGLPDTAIGYEYGTGLASTDGILLLNGSTGSIAVRDDATDLVRIHYGGWFPPPPADAGTARFSIQLKSASIHTDSVLSSGWCVSLKPWPGGVDMGTPGSASDCP